jgi:hypothetical protein
VTRRVNPGLRFKAFATAQRTIQGYDAIAQQRRFNIDLIASVSSAAWEFHSSPRNPEEAAEVTGLSERGKRRDASPLCASPRRCRRVPP